MNKQVVKEMFLGTGYAPIPIGRKMVLGPLKGRLVEI